MAKIDFKPILENASKDELVELCLGQADTIYALELSLERERSRNKEKVDCLPFKKRPTFWSALASGAGIAMAIAGIAISLVVLLSK